MTLQLCAEICEYFDLDKFSLIKGSLVNSFGIMHFNIRGLAGKINELQNLITTAKEQGVLLHVILLCETFIKDLHVNYCNIEDYDFVYSNRSGRMGGGIGIYVHKTVDYIERPDLNVFLDGKVESVFIEIKFNRKSLIVGEIYRVPNIGIHESIEHYSRILRSISATNADVILGTDQNIDLLKLDQSSAVRDFVNECTSFGFFPCTDKATRVTTETQTAIDNIYTRGISNCCRAGILETSLSDHYPIVMCIDIPNTRRSKNERVTIQFRNESNENMRRLDTELLRSDWSVLSNGDLNDAYEAFMRILTMLIDQIMPIKTKSIRYDKLIRVPWFTQGIRKSRLKLDKLYGSYLKKGKGTAAHEKYLRYRNTYNSVKRAAKEKYYSDLFNEHQNDAKETWAIINKIIGSNKNRNSVIKRISVNGRIIEDPSEIGENFAEYFANVGASQAEAMQRVCARSPQFEDYMTTHISRSLYLSPTSELEILEILDGLKNKRSRGQDDLSPHFIKKIKYGLARPLCLLINRSFSDGTFPDQMKISKTIAIYKKNDKESMDNYRPIALLSTFSKVFEKVFCKRLLSFLNNNNVLSESQYGFRKKRSTVHAVLEFYLHTINSMLNGEQVLATYIDMSKAFDTVKHDILLKKLSMYGVRGPALSWVRSYLNDRSLFVLHDSHKSKQVLLKPFGVPQGSVIGPILFLVYTNDVTACLKHSKTILFADDTTLFISKQNSSLLYSQMNEDLAILSDWCNSNSLKVNVAKCNYMLFNEKRGAQTNDDVKMLNTKILRVATFKLLGIMIDEKLKWKQHIDHLNKKLSSGLYALRMVKNQTPRNVLKTIYFALIHSHLSYGNLVWGNAGPTLLKKLIVQQKKAIRLIHKVPYNTTSMPLFTRSRILPLRQITKLQIAQILHQLHNRTLPPLIAACFTRHAVTHPHHLRRTAPFRIPLANSTSTHQSILNNAHQISRNIPPNLLTLKPSAFKNKFKELLLSEI